jgi:hypothetical protein
MGGMKIINVGGGHGKKSGFIYTVGFSSLAGGKELLLQDVHRSMSGSNINRTFNWMFSRHKEGHHLHPGHTVDTGDGVGYLVTAPKDAYDATFLKPTTMLDATRLYGVAWYEILILTAVGLKHQDEDDATVAKGEDASSASRLSREEILLSAMGIDITGVTSLGQGKTKKLEACAYCHQVRDTTEQKPLFRCGGCTHAYYCCSQHQKWDWAVHKKTCQLSKEEQEQKKYAPFTKEEIFKNKAVNKDGIFPK